jgi:pimeloyl-ACP methyl ester carboxylesterase
MVESALRQAIGLDLLPQRTPLAPRIMARHEMGDYLVENLLFESRPGFPVSANLYRLTSKSSRRRAAVLCPIGHYLSAGKTAPDVQARCIKLAQMGFVVLVYDAIGQGERMFAGNIHHDAGFALLPLGETIAGWMVWDSMRAIDYLLTREDVDAGRIGVTGNSGGGLNTLFTAALDQRVRAAVVGGYTFEFNNWLKYGGTHCTCTHLPGMFRAFEWFEVAALIAPRALMMLQGDRDAIFPISGARQAGHNTEAVYALLGKPEQARFRELPAQPHAYSRPYREIMYGWMAKHLLAQGNGEPIAEGEVHPLSEDDPRLICDQDGSALSGAPSVIDLARNKGMEAVAKLPPQGSQESSQASRWVHDLTAPPDAQAQYLAPEPGKPRRVRGGLLEEFSFSSEDGEYIPCLLWMPQGQTPRPRILILLDDRGKKAAAESGLVEPLLDAGFAMVALDLRGRGETLGHFGSGWDVNFRLLALQSDIGKPLAGRRAFDLQRAVDYLGLRSELAIDDLTVVGLGEDALPALLAAAADQRIGRVAVVGYFHSFISQMRARTPRTREEMREGWNDPQLKARISCADYEVDFGSVIPSALKFADVPDIAALIAPRKLLFCQARDYRSSGTEALVARFRHVTESAGNGWMRYEPKRSLEASLLLEWIGQGG